MNSTHLKRGHICNEIKLVITTAVALKVMNILYCLFMSPKYNTQYSIDCAICYKRLKQTTR